MVTMVIFDTTGPQVKLTYIDLENSTIISRFYIILHLCGKPHHFYRPHGFALAFPMVSVAFPASLARSWAASWRFTISSGLAEERQPGSTFSLASS